MDIYFHISVFLNYTSSANTKITTILSCCAWIVEYFGLTHIQVRTVCKIDFLAIPIFIKQKYLIFECEDGISIILHLQAIWSINYDFYLYNFRKEKHFHYFPITINRVFTNSDRLYIFHIVNNEFENEFKCFWKRKEEDLYYIKFVLLIIKCIGKKYNILYSIINTSL